MYLHHSRTIYNYSIYVVWHTGCVLNRAQSSDYVLDAWIIYCFVLEIQYGIIKYNLWLWRN